MPSYLRRGGDGGTILDLRFDPFRMDDRSNLHTLPLGPLQSLLEYNDEDPSLSSTVTPTESRYANNLPLIPFKCAPLRTKSCSQCVSPTF